MPAAAPPAPVATPAAPVTPTAPVDAAGVKPPAQAAASSIPAPTEPVKPPKPGSAKAKMFGELERYAKGPAGAPAEPAAPEPPPPVQAAASPTEGQGEPPAPAQPGEPAEPTEPDRNRPNKPNREWWQAFDRWKSRATQAEAELSKAKEALTPETDRKGYADRIQALEKRNNELEEQIRFVDYSKSGEFQSKYQQPYEAAWKRAMDEVGQLQIVVNPETGEVRGATAQDLAGLVSMPLGEARQVAEKMFGPFADDVMAYRKEIRTLWDSQAAALEDAKKNAGERQKQMAEQQGRFAQQLQEGIKNVWNDANKASLEHPQFGQFFRPVEGNTEINSRLEKGYKLVDQAFSESPTDPRLTPEQRAAVIRRHAAVRNRAAAFGRLTYELSQAQSKISELTKQLEGYTKSTPAAGGRGGAPAAPAAPVKAWDRLRGDLEKIAKPA